MKNQALFALMVVSIVLFSAYQINAGGSTLYPWPTDFSPGSIASWSQPLMASGTSLPSAGNAAPGDLFIDLATAGSPSLWRKGSSDWEQMSGGAGGAGVSSHSLLAELDYSSSGHTGFVSTSTLLAHSSNQFDPHGASETITQGISVGSGSYDANITRTASGVLTIASYAAILPATATPTDDVATGTLWYDENTNKLRCFDGTAWQNLF